MPTPSDVFAVVSPDGNLFAEIHNGYPLRVGFRPGSYRGYAEPTLAHQLGQLARMARVSFLRDQRARWDDSRRAGEASDPRRRGYRADLRRIVATATSPQQWVSVWTTGLEEWRFDLAPGALHTLDEAELTGEVEGAGSRVVAEYERQVILLKDAHFGFDLPTQLRQRLEPARRQVP